MDIKKVEKVEKVDDMKLKVGDKVRIRKDLKSIINPRNNETPDGLYINSSMFQFAGKKGKIVKILQHDKVDDGIVYKLGFTSRWVWSVGCFDEMEQYSPYGKKIKADLSGYPDGHKEHVKVEPVYMKVKGERVSRLVNMRVIPTGLVVPTGGARVRNCRFTICHGLRCEIELGEDYIKAKGLMCPGCIRVQRGIEKGENVEQKKKV